MARLAEQAGQASVAHMYRKVSWFSSILPGGEKLYIIYFWHL
jgi:hypothetical protein